MALGLTPALVVGGIIAAGGAGTSSNEPVGLSAGSEVTLIGHGHGHGRGMGQWGAFGYAKRGWSANQILRHYYGGTAAGRVGDPGITVTLSRKNSVNVSAQAGMRVAGQDVAPGQAVSLSGGTVTITQGCGGAVVRSIPMPNPTVDPINGDPDRPEQDWLRFCGSGDAFRGSLGLENGRVVNKLHIDDYIKGVIAKESIPSWVDQGGAEALKAQAIAARSYALAAIAGGKQIDDTQGSQVYAGVSGEDPRTNPLADQTAGQIITLNGQPALAEYSASTGGYTAGGLFPAVIDEGDSLSPTRNWTATVSSGSIASAFGVGQLRSIEVIEANGLGAENGRAIKIRVVGSSRTVEATGEEARVKLQLKSSWFAVEGQQTPPRIVTPPTGPGGGGFGSLDLGPLTQLGNLIPGTQQLLDMGTAALNGRFDELGGSAGPLGAPLAPAVVAPGGSEAVVQLFQKGMMLFTQAQGVRALSGRGLAEYQEQGGLPELGVPEGDVLE